MEENRRNYSEEFKKSAQLAHSMKSENSVEEVAGDLGITQSNLRKWRA